MKIVTPPRTNEQVREKVAVVATALTLFYFCNPSNVLGPFTTPRLTFREVNLQYYGGRVKIHLPRKKTQKRKCQFTIGSGHIQVPLLRIEVKLEGESSSESKVACCGCRKRRVSDRIGGANDHFLGKESLF